MTTASGAGGVMPNNAPVPNQAFPERYGEVFDRGYQHYDGPRLGRRHAVRALITYSIKRAMGIKKSWTAKVIPFLIYLGAALLAVIPVGIESFVDQEVYTYSTFFQWIYILMGVFVATIAPEMLCGDRRENVLSLYFSRAITRMDYLFAKLAATAILTLTVSFLPAFVLWLGRNLLGGSPLSAIRDSADLLAKIALAGILIAFYMGAAGLTIASFTGRKAIAVAVTIIGFVVLESFANVLIEIAPNDIARWLVFLSPSNTVIGLIAQLFPSPEDVFGGLRLLPAWAFVTEMVLFILACIGIMYWRYVPGE